MERTRDILVPLKRDPLPSNPNLKYNLRVQLVASAEINLIYVEKKRNNVKCLFEFHAEQ